MEKSVFLLPGKKTLKNFQTQLAIIVVLITAIIVILQQPSF